MNRKRIIYFLCIIIFIVLNGYILVHRNDGFKYYPLKTYSEIYQTDSSFFIKNLFFTNDSVHITFSQKPKADEYFLENEKIKVRENAISFPLKKNFQIYTLIPAESNFENIVFHIDHSKLGPQIFTNEFLYSNIPGPGISTTPLNIWENGIEQYATVEIEKGRQLLNEKTNISTAISDSAKLMEIISFISTIHSNSSGVEVKKMNGFSPYIQIAESLKNNAQLDCGNYSRMLAFLCDIENLPNRRVTYRGPDGNWRFGVHYMNEIYLREKQTWILADALNNIYWPQDSTHIYNAVSIKKIFEVNGLTGKKVFTFQHDSLLIKNYSDLAYWHEYYNTSNASIAFLYPDAEIQKSTLHDLLDFYSFTHHEIWYNDNKQNDWPKIILKTISFYGLIILFASWMFSELKFLKKQKNHSTHNIKDL